MASPASCCDFYQTDSWSAWSWSWLRTTASPLPLAAANGAGHSRTAPRRSWHPFCSTSNLWPSKHRHHYVCIRRRPSHHACWWRLASSGRGTKRRHGNSCEYLQTCKLKLITTKTRSAVFHLNNREAKPELKVNHNNETLPLCPEPKNLGVTLDRSLTYRRHLESLRKKLTSPVTLLRRLADTGRGAATAILRSATSAPVHSTAEYCVPAWSRSAHTRLTNPAINDVLTKTTNCDWMPAPYTSGQPSYSRRHLTCWTSSQRSHTVSSTPYHGSCTSAPLSPHLSIEC